MSKNMNKFEASASVSREAEYNQLIESGLSPDTIKNSSLVEFRRGGRTPADYDKPNDGIHGTINGLEVNVSSDGSGLVNGKPINKEASVSLYRKYLPLAVFLANDTKRAKGVGESKSLEEWDLKQEEVRKQTDQYSEEILKQL